MKVSYNWLKELLPDLQKTPEEIAEALTLHSFETVVAGKIAIDPKVTVAKIIAIAPHPNADRLRLATVDTGTEKITVVCGAQNIEVGQVVPFSPPGTVVKDDTEKDVTLKVSTIRGIQSPGMINSPRELGLGDWHGGIYVLPPDTHLGSKLVEHLPADTILEADITPNRAHDALSHVGIARELAAILDLSPPAFAEASAGKPSQMGGRKNKIPFTINNPQHTPRYLGAYLTNIKIIPSPLWLQARLWSAGAKPINNVVDITNYVTFELGNPSHAFDAEKLPGHTISARPARKNEVLATLDGETHTLIAENLVITSNDTPVAIAGVMGGEATQVTNQTQAIFLEVANFEPFVIQESARALKVKTESSARFSKSISPELSGPAAARLLSLLTEHVGAFVTGILEYYPNPPVSKTITFNPSRVSKIAGIDISDALIKTGLTKLRFQIEGEKESWKVTPPTDRIDITGEHDVVEEAIRVVGLEKIPARAPDKVKPTKLPPHVRVREALRDAFVLAGFVELYNYSFELENLAVPLGLLDDNALEIANPVAPEQKYLRQSLLPRLLENLVTNKAEIRKRESPYAKSLFEINSVFQKGDSGLVPGVREHEELAGVSLNQSPESILAALLTALEKVLPKSHLELSPSTREGSQNILLNDQVIGTVGPLNPARKLKLPYSLLREAAFSVFEIRLDKLT